MNNQYESWPMAAEVLGLSWPSGRWVYDRSSSTFDYVAGGDVIMSITLPGALALSRRYPECREAFRTLLDAPVGDSP